MQYSLYKKKITLAKVNNGFVLPFTMLIVSIILLIVGTGANILSKQLYFSKIYKQSQMAYYAADDAVSCVIALDDTFLDQTGQYGIFPYDNAQDPDTYIDDVINNFGSQRATIPKPDAITSANRNSIKCGQVAIFDSAESEMGFDEYIRIVNGVPESGVRTQFFMKMPLGDGTFRCAKVTVNKTPSSFRQIIAQGYASCNNASHSIERAVVNTTIVQ